MKSYCLLLLLCSTHIYAKQVLLEHGTRLYHNTTLPTDKTPRLDNNEADYLMTNIIEVKHISTRQAAEKDPVPKVRASYVHLPEEQIRCNKDADCLKHSLPLRCGQDGLCECTENLCWTYYTDTSKWPVVNVFTCDTCGKLGSSCNLTLPCNEPGRCMMDGYCHCRHNGEHDDDGICWMADTSWAMTIAVGAMGIILLFAIMVTAYNLYVTRPWQNGCGRRRATPDVLHQNIIEGETNKSPAFTVRDYYGYTPVTLPEGTPQPEQVDGEVANTSSASPQIDEPTASTSSGIIDAVIQTASTSSTMIQEPVEIQVTNSSELKTDDTVDSNDGSIYQKSRCNVVDSSTDSSARSSISSNASTVNSERPLVSSSRNSSTQNGHLNGFSISKVLNREQRRRDECSDSTRF